MAAVPGFARKGDRTTSSTETGIDVSQTGMLFMAAVLAFVWGGFLLILITAARKERRKRQ